MGVGIVIAWSHDCQNQPEESLALSAYYYVDIFFLLVCGSLS